MGMYIKYTLILCDLFSFEVRTYDVPLICACRCLAVFGAAYLTGPCERKKKKNILLRMNESCVKAFHRGKL